MTAIRPQHADPSIVATMSEPSNEQTAVISAPKPVRGRPFPPGVSGNPNGRPRKLEALADAVRRRSDPDELADIAIAIAKDPKQAASVRLQALQWLRDSGYARPAERHELAVERHEPAYDFSKLPLEARMQLHEQLEACRVDADESGNGRLMPQGGDEQGQIADDGASCPGGGR